MAVAPILRMSSLGATLKVFLKAVKCSKGCSAQLRYKLTDLSAIGRHVLKTSAGFRRRKQHWDAVPSP